MDKGKRLISKPGIENSDAEMELCPKPHLNEMNYLSGHPLDSGDNY